MLQLPAFFVRAEAGNSLRLYNRNNIPCSCHTGSNKYAVLLHNVCCTAAVSNAVDGRQTCCTTVAVRAADGCRTTNLKP